MGIVAVGGQEPPEGVLHGSGGGGIDVALDRRQVHDALAHEEIGEAQPSGVDALEHAHLGLGLVGHPLHIALFKVVEHGDAVAPKDRQVVVQILAFESAGHHGLVLHADQLVITARLQRQHRALQLPGRGVRAGEGVMPGDVVLQDHRLALRQIALHLGQPQQAVVILQHRAGAGVQDGHPGARRHRGAPSMRPTGMIWACIAEPVSILPQPRARVNIRCPFLNVRAAASGRWRQSSAGRHSCRCARCSR